METALEGVKVEKASKPSAGEESLWKLWGLRGAERKRSIQDMAEEERGKGRLGRQTKSRKKW